MRHFIPLIATTCYVINTKNDCFISLKYKILKINMLIMDILKTRQASVQRSGTCLAHTKPWQTQLANKPPSTTKSAAFTSRDSSDAKYTTA